MRVGDRLVMAGAGGRSRAVAAEVVARQNSPATGKLPLDDAIFTAPSHPHWGGGAALIGPAGELTGIGSLQLQQGGRDNRAINMAVPIDLLKPILHDLTTFAGLRAAPALARSLRHRDGRPGRGDGPLAPRPGRDRGSPRRRHPDGGGPDRDRRPRGLPARRLGARARRHHRAADRPPRRPHAEHPGRLGRSRDLPGRRRGCTEDSARVPPSASVPPQGRGERQTVVSPRPARVPGGDNSRRSSHRSFRTGAPCAARGTAGMLARTRRPGSNPLLTALHTASSPAGARLRSGTGVPCRVPLAALPFACAA